VAILVSSTFWWHVGLVFGGISLMFPGAHIVDVSTLAVAGFAFAASGVLGVIEDLRGASKTPPQ